jgi:hypothetical protein
MVSIPASCFVSDGCIYCCLTAHVYLLTIAASTAGWGTFPCFIQSKNPKELDDFWEKASHVIADNRKLNLSENELIITL